MEDLIASLSSLPGKLGDAVASFATVQQHASSTPATATVGYATLAATLTASISDIQSAWPEDIALLESQISAGANLKPRCLSRVRKIQLPYAKFRDLEPACV